MSRSARFLWTTGVLSALAFAWLAFLSHAQLTPAPGLGPFDGRIGGYGPDEARAYLGALTQPARAVYLGTFRLWDTIFPALLALTAGGVIWTRSRGWEAWMRGLLTSVPLAGMLMDYRENALVAEMLRQGPGVADAAVDAASQATVLKWALLLLTLTTCAAVLLRGKGARA